MLTKQMAYWSKCKCEKLADLAISWFWVSSSLIAHTVQCNASLNNLISLMNEKIEQKLLFLSVCKFRFYYYYFE